MKKKILFTLLIIAILSLIALSVYIYIKDSKVIETPAYSTDSYSIKETDDSIVQTLYYASANPIKLVINLKLIDDKVTSVTMDAHYENISYAKSAMKIKYDDCTLTRNNNIVTVTLISGSPIGQERDEVIKNFIMNNWDKTQINEE
jgi:hypothetical protein